MKLFQKKAEKSGTEAEKQLENAAETNVTDAEEQAVPAAKKKAAKPKGQQQKGAIKMPWRLIKLVLILLFAIIFAAFNIDNRCDVSLVFVSFKNVPVFVTMFVAFCIGILFVLPFTIGRDSAVKKAQEAAAEVEELKAQKAMWLRQRKMPKNKHEKKSFFWGKSKKADAVPATTEPVEQKTENGDAAGK